MSTAKNNAEIFESFFETIDEDLEKKAVDAVNAFTREFMWRLWHIPFRYYLPGGKSGDFEKLAAEIDASGYIDLDADGEPCCLSGKPPMLEAIKQARQEQR
jgi:hypothetical protein